MGALVRRPGRRQGVRDCSSRARSPTRSSAQAPLSRGPSPASPASESNDLRHRLTPFSASRAGRMQPRACAVTGRVGDPRAAASPASIDVERSAREIDAFDTADRAAPPAPGGIVFVGSSTIRLWSTLGPGLCATARDQRRFGGSTFPDALHYLQRTVVRYHPRTVVVYEATTISRRDARRSRSPTTTAPSCAVCATRSLSARIIFLAIKPSPSRWAFESQRQEANRLVRAIVSADPKQTFIDVGTPMLDPGGRPRPAALSGGQPAHDPRRVRDLALDRRAVPPVIESGRTSRARRVR